MLTINAKIKSGALRWTSCIGSTPATPAIAITAPQTGEQARPSAVLSSIGRIKVTAGIPSLAAISGISGPKAKNGAAPLPIITANAKVINDKSLHPKLGFMRRKERINKANKRTKYEINVNKHLDVLKDFISKLNLKEDI